ncbi:hypothetical protein Daesc_003604 [Daldinia eschscholtzii]|uniref:Uncharacterized protein n=1 Tax=Daldinia eschscholtzii TaxID=292717 RepID=A0AAX6MU79_9PEZI
MSLASPTSKDGFSYAGDLFAEASGHNRHRRATVAELKDHFQSGSEKDHPAHWFEAQLIHYGLQVSKTKAVARMRLFDAVNGGNLAVPAHIKRLESELKKEWTKKEREAKKAIKDATASSPAPKNATTAGGKRKAESSNVDVTVSVGGINVTVSASNTAKKVKSSSSKSATTTTTTAAHKPGPKPKAPKTPITASKATSGSASTTTTSKSTTSKVTTSKTTTTTKTTTAGSAFEMKPKPTPRRGGIRQGPSRESSSPAPTARFVPGAPYARRGGGWATRGRGNATPPSYRNHSSYSPSPVKNEYSDDNDNDNHYVKREDSNDDEEELKPLGLLNGRYVLTSEYVTAQWGHTEFSLVFTLSGTELWGVFDLGIAEGVLRLPQRPWQSSPQPLGFTWRGRELYGPIIYGDNNAGTIRFLGGGRIEGSFDWMGITFEGRRADGQGTRSEVDINSMRADWDGYNEDEYERERVNRWR